MTILHMTLGAIPYHDPSKGTHIIHAFIHQSEPTMTDVPGDERRAAKDCAKIVGDLVRENVNRDEERLLQEGEMPPDVLPVYTFAIGVSWDRQHKMPSYKGMGFETLWSERKFAPVCNLGAELYGETLKVLKNRERRDRGNAGAAKFKPDRITLEHGRDEFTAFCSATKRRHMAWEINKMRFECPNLRNGFCSPSKPSCPCYHNGSCVEAKA